MKLYEIDEALLGLVDPETGEIIDIEAFNELSMARDAKLEGIALWVKELTAEETALAAEEKAFRTRKEAAKRKRESLTGYLREMLGGESFKTNRVAIRYQRNPPHVALANEGDVIDWCRTHGREDLLRVTTEANRAKIMGAIKSGDVIEGAEIVQDTRMVIQ